VAINTVGKSSTGTPLIDTYAGNTTSSYTTKLSKRTELDGEHKVGLSEFIYPLLGSTLTILMDSIRLIVSK